ncbi:MAG: 16S rRNA (guanine(527)-N(7))-methyltransferase RsmG [Candidatus Metalachnospira sp.]|nr:16S rRNA (guanine(527)-N(7))-methyltransferase RsmG [Candidatus Metalachnospira sp.]
MSPLEELLCESCRKIGVELNQAQLKQFTTYKDMLIEWNEKMNLTAITDDREIILKHFVDCLALCSGADMSGKKIIDVGTGAGFPGVPVKIACPDIDITLLDSLNKRITFLNELTKALGLEKTDCVHMRAEDGGNDKGLRESFDMCISRAVANLAVLCEYCLPFVRVGGMFISMKGPDVSQEISEAEKAIKVLGGEISEIKKVSIPETDINHSLIIIKKIRSTPSKYPRKAGKVKKEPIM